MKSKIKQYVVYTITNQDNGKVYVGITRNFRARMGAHLGALKNEKRQYVIHKAMIKHGVDNFKPAIIEQFEVNEGVLSPAEIQEAYEKLKTREKYYIKKLNSLVPNGYNITKGGGGTVGYKRPPEDCAEISERMKMNVGDKNPFYGKEHSDESKQMMSEARKTNWKNGTYDESSIAHRKFTPEEEQDIADEYARSGMMIKELMTKYNIARGTAKAILKRCDAIVVRREWTEEHKEKCRANLKLASAVYIEACKELKATITAKIIDLRKQGLLQAEIGERLGLSQCVVSKHLIDAGFRSQTKKDRKRL